MAGARQSITVDGLWEKISNDIEHLFQWQTIRYSKWMLIHTYIFDYCSNGNSDCADLYESFQNYLRKYLENLCESLRNLHGQDIVERYVKQWRKYRLSSKILHGICSYLHRHYVRRERDPENSDIHEIYQVAMEMWHQVISKVCHEKITEICLNMIRSERHQQTIDTEVIRNLIQIYITFHIDGQTCNWENDSDLLNFYQEYFEDRFLNDTADFYRSEAKIYLQRYSLMDYLSKISQWFNEEIYRVAAYLHSSTTPKITRTLEAVLIRDQLLVIYDQAKNLIRDEKTEKLNLLYQTVNRIENGTIELRNLLENHIYQIAIEQINLLPTNDLKIYIQTIYDLHEKYLTFIQKAFNNDQGFIHTLDRTFRKFVNNNSFIQAIDKMTSMAQSLARHCDELLQKRRKEEIDLNPILQQIQVLLYYMQDKDVFEKFYSKLLAKRLIGRTSISNDYEKSMISTIQNACGLEYVSKIKQMCQDIETSEHMLEQYSKTEHIDHKINFSILILHSNAWSFSIPSNIILPNELQAIFNHFTEFYKQMHNARKLMWLHQYSKGELKTFFTERIYTLQVSMYQMMILLLFNNSSEWTIERIHDQTQIEIDLLLQILNLDMNCTITLSNQFTSDKSRVNLNKSVKSSRTDDEEVLQKNINQGRIMVIQAAIVRIMKSQKTMNQNSLIQTVIEQLNSHFHPSIPMIKDYVTTLINKEYLERPLHDSDLLYYIS